MTVELNNLICLREETRDKIFKHGEIVELGNYWIGWDMSFGIHIPVQSIEQGKSIMQQIIDNQKFIDEYNKPYKLRIPYHILEQQTKEVKKEVEWKIGQLNHIEKNEDYEILDNETNLKVHYHRKGFIEGLKWYLKTLEDIVEVSK